MKRILVFGITDNPGGIESVIMNYYKKFNKSNIQLDFLCNTNIVAYEDEIKSLGGQVFRITARSTNLRKYKKELKNFFKCNSYKYDAIWVNVCSLANIDYLKYAKRYGIKRRIIHSHNSQNMDSFARGLLHKFNKLFLKKYATDFWSCSNSASKWFYNKKIINSKKYLLINNAIDCNKFKYNQNTRDEYRNKYNIEKKYVIINVGRLHFQKNQLFILDIFNEYLKINKDAILFLVGDGEDKKAIEQKIELLNLNQYVRLLGKRNDVENLYMMSDLLIFPSLFEGLSLALLEAQASGINIIASDTISEETIMSNNFSTLPLNTPTSEWAEEISKLCLMKDSREYNSNINISRIQNNGFDIDKEVFKLEKELI